MIHKNNNKKINISNKEREKWTRIDNQKKYFNNV